MRLSVLSIFFIVLIGTVSSEVNVNISSTDTQVIEGDPIQFDFSLISGQKCTGSVSLINLDTKRQVREYTKSVKCNCGSDYRLQGVVQRNFTFTTNESGNFKIRAYFTEDGGSQSIEEYNFTVLPKTTTTTSTTSTIQTTTSIPSTTLSPEIEKKQTKKVIVIGLDGATWKTLKPWVDKGNMPYLKSLMDGGAYGNLTSSIPDVSPVAWPSFSTGNLPGKHGIYGFQQCRGTEKPRIPLADSIKSPRLWQILSENGFKSIVINIQNTYPPDKIDGVHISGVMAPNIAVHPGTLKPWLKNEGYIVEGKGWMNTEKDEFLKSLYETTEKRFEVSGKLMEKEEWDFFMVLITGTDRIQHYLWGDMEKGGKYKNSIEDYYKSLDPQIEDLVKKAGENVTVIILSDHGFDRLERRVHINWWLKDEGYLTLEDNWENRKSLWTIRLSGFLKKTGLNEVIRKLFVKSGQNAVMSPPKLTVDYEKTTAYTCGYYTGQIYLNPALTSEKYDETQKELMEKLLKIRDPKNGKQVVKEVYRKQDLYKSGYTGESPDILMVYNTGYWMVGSFSYPSMFETTFRETGSHDLEGILIANGPNVKPGKIEDARLIDVSPSILSMYGLTEQMDGDPIKQISQ